MARGRLRYTLTMAKRRVVLWADKRQLAMINLALRAGSLEVAACGGDAGGDASALAERTGATILADLRTAIGFENADAVWIASATPLSREHHEVIRRQSRPVFVALPPLASTRQDVPISIHTMPLFRRCVTLRGGVDLMQTGAPWQAMHIALCAPADAIPLASSLYSALDLIVTFGGRVEAVSTSLAGTNNVPETPLGLTGHLAAQLRLEDGAATVLITDRAGGFDRRATLLGAESQLNLDDSSIRLTRSHGATDEHAEGGTHPLGAIIGREMAQIIDGESLTPPPDHARLSMLCETVLLACRTGQTESPRNVERMSERV